MANLLGLFLTLGQGRPLFFFLAPWTMMRWSTAVLIVVACQERASL
jgi:hypothetical protein